ncbi:hypothetical protein V7654_15190 [Bacillus sp. JJ1609]|uniref:hypothetical protein n=1 Tax=Bacillus sp. JJ1609 TaxID=3122977 RepID=UPI002FFDCC66
MYGTKQSPFAYLFMKESFSMPVKGKCTGRQFPLFSIDGFISIMYDNPVFVKRLFSLTKHMIYSKMQQSIRKKPVKNKSTIPIERWAGVQIENLKAPGLICESDNWIS